MLIFALFSIFRRDDAAFFRLPLIFMPSPLRAIMS